MVVLQKSGEGFITYMSSQYKRVPKLATKVPRYCFLLVSLAMMSSGQQNTPTFVACRPVLKVRDGRCNQARHPADRSVAIGQLGPSALCVCSAKRGGGWNSHVLTFFFGFQDRGNVKGSALPRTRHRIPFVLDINLETQVIYPRPPFQPWKQLPPVSSSFRMQHGAYSVLLILPKRVYR